MPCCDEIGIGELLELIRIDDMVGGMYPRLLRAVLEGMSVRQITEAHGRRFAGVRSRDSRGNSAVITCTLRDVADNHFKLPPEQKARWAT